MSALDPRPKNASKRSVVRFDLRKVFCLQSTNLVVLCTRREFMRIHSFKMLLVIVAFLAGSICANAQESRDIGELIAQLDDENNRTRQDAAEALAEIVDAKVSSPLRKRIAVENDFHVSLALHYALAAQSDKQALLFLIDSLEESGHLGYVYLSRVTGEDFGWKIEAYRAWFVRTSDDDFQLFINRRWERKPMMDEWRHFASLLNKQYFSSLSGAESSEPERLLGYRITDGEIQVLSRLPTKKAWDLFESAISQLQDNGDRKEAAKLFRKVATDFTNTYYSDQSKELADLLEKMVVDDVDYKPPANIALLELKQQIDFHIHNLRDVVAYQFSQPGYCSVLNQLDLPDDDSYNAAVALRDIGEPAVPRLIELLNDRRPIRAVGYWRDFQPTRTVLRYQDAAIEIISAIRSDRAYERRTTSSYFSTERPEIQRAVLDSLTSEANSK